MKERLPIQKLLFGVCIFIRLLIPFLISTNTFNTQKFVIDYKPYIAIGSVYIALGFLFLYLFNMRKTGVEVFGGEIWWNFARPYHAFNFFIFGWLLTVFGDTKYLPYLTFPLFVDVLMGIYCYYNIVYL